MTYLGRKNGKHIGHPPNKLFTALSAVCKEISWSYFPLKTASLRKCSCPQFTDEETGLIIKKLAKITQGGKVASSPGV